MKQFASWFTHGVPGGATLRRQIFEAKRGAQVMDKIEGNLTPGTQAFAAAQFQAHAQMLVYFSASAEFLGDVQVTAQNSASAQHWLVLI